MPRTTIRSEDVTDAQIKTADMAVDPTNATNLTSGSVPLAALGNAPATDTTGLRDDIALLAFQTQANGSLAKYSLVDQTIDSFEDATGINLSTSSGEYRSTTNYFVGAGTTDTQTAFTSTGTTSWAAPSGIVGTTKVLVVAGGGAGGEQGNGCAGSGAGGLVYVSNYSAVGGTTYNITVGAGGVGHTNYAVGSDGSDSIFDSGGSHQILTASGGGHGAVYAQPSGNGGSGGGGANAASAAGTTDQIIDFGVYTGVGFGFGGGTNGTGPAASGGGGAGGAGQPYGTLFGQGGLGKDYSAVFGTSVGDQGWFSGGGGGGTCAGSGQQGLGNGGQPYGGGGDGGWDASGEAGMANTGGGAGGSRCDVNGSPGGSGVVIVKYTAITSYNSMDLISNGVAAVGAAPTKADIVMTYTMGAGTPVLNVGGDLIAYASRDGGTTYTPVTLVSQGTTGGHSIVTAHDVDISSQPDPGSGNASMIWKISTSSQSSSKTTRIQAVSLGWS